MSEEAMLVPRVTADEIEVVRKTVASGATDAELKLYLYDCARQGVHPLDRLLHFTKRGGRYVPVTSIDLMRMRAADTGEYAGSDDAAFLGGGEYPSQATVTVWRLVQGTRYPFSATARWSEYKPEQNDFQWKKMPHTMLAKCAEALALRKGFPRQLAGLYAKEELDQAGNDALPATNGRLAEPAPVKPEGFDEELADFEAKADEGWEALQTAWKRAKPEFRAALGQPQREALKQRAREADAKRQAATP